MTSWRYCRHYYNKSTPFNMNTMNNRITVDTIVRDPDFNVIEAIDNIKLVDLIVKKTVGVDEDVIRFVERMKSLIETDDLNDRTVSRFLERRMPYLWPVDRLGILEACAPLIMNHAETIGFIGIFERIKAPYFV